jgi:hypothetical protein
MFLRRNCDAKKIVKMLIIVVIQYKIKNILLDVIVELQLCQALIAHLTHYPY